MVTKVMVLFNEETNILIEFDQANRSQLTRSTLSNGV